MFALGASEAADPYQMAGSSIHHRWWLAVILMAVFALAAATAAVLWRVVANRMRRDAWVRENYRGVPIVAVSGLLVIVVTAFVIAASVAVISVTGAGEQILVVERSPGDWFVYSPSRGTTSWLASTLRTWNTTEVTGAIAAVAAAVFFGLLGYRDDTKGSGPGHDPGAVGGFAGHLRRTWRSRRLTTGMQKALFGFAGALVCVHIALWSDVTALFGASHSPATGSVLLHLDTAAGADGWSPVTLVRGALVVALGANLLNLVDRVPGRATKVALAWWLGGLVPAAVVTSSWTTEPSGASWVALALLDGGPVLWATAAVGASVGLLRSELAERHMQGDTGVNATGAVLGLATVMVSPAAVSWVVLAVLAALNLVSERWSFSQVIDSFAPLRWLDRLGSPHRHD